MKQIIKLKSIAPQPSVNQTIASAFKLTPINPDPKPSSTCSDTSSDCSTSLKTQIVPPESKQKSYVNQIISDTNLDLDEKIRKGIKPEHADKKKLQSRIKTLNKQQQLQLFYTIIKPLNIYRVTNTGTFFDLNELTPEQFWKLSYHINLTYDCINRNKVINEFEREHSNLYQLDSDLISVNDSELDSLLTIKGLNRSTVFPTFNHPTQQQQETKNFNHEYEAKVLERNVYTDKRRGSASPPLTPSQ